MSNIPELNEDEVSWIAYYDVTEHTDLTEINTEELNEDVEEVKKVTSYDNGVELEYETVNRIAFIRATDDGWITAHLDRTENYIEYDENNEQNMYENSFENIEGTHDIIDWTQENQLSDITDNELEKAINTCLESLDSWSSEIEENYNSEDVGIYNYQHNSENVSVFAEKLDSGDSSNTNAVFDYNIVYTDTTNIKQIILCGASRSSNFNSRNTNLKFNDVHIYRTNDERGYSAIDITDKVSAGEEIKIGIGPGRTSTGQIAVHVIVIWE